MIVQKFHLIIIGFGDLIIQKYINCFQNNIKNGAIYSYSIIDLDNQKENIEKRLINIEIQPENIFYLSSSLNSKAHIESIQFQTIIKNLKENFGMLKVFISTEVKAHEEYLRFCIFNDISSLVEKPILTPMKDGFFYPSIIDSTMDELIKNANQRNSKHSVMCLGRYHQIYNDVIYESLKEKMLKYEAPLTSLNLRTSSGVWNFYKEYEEREDHPYKYGYGMLMHGAYHYIDLLAQFLELNKIIFPNFNFDLILSSFSCNPNDQNIRIPQIFNNQFDDIKNTNINYKNYGETDITTTFCLKCTNTNQILTLGTFGLEQTTPSYRNWKKIPSNTYNKNGRMSCTSIEAQLSTIYSIYGHILKKPLAEKNKIIKADNFAEVCTRANAFLLPEEQFTTFRTFNNFTNTNSNIKLLEQWIKNEDTKSELYKHRNTMRITQALANSIKNIGKSVRISNFL